MTLEEETPDPPSLSGPQYRGEYEAIDEDPDDVQDDYRREELASLLNDGAWEDAFGEWAATSGLTAADFAPVVERGYIDQFDFYWDPHTDDVGYHAPTVDESDHDAFDDVDVDEIDAELDALGRMVTEVLENDYLLRDDPDEQYGFFPDEESTDDL